MSSLQLALFSFTGIADAGRFWPSKKRALDPLWDMDSKMKDGKEEEQVVQPASPIDSERLQIDSKVLTCPLTLEPFRRPVITTCGHTFEEEALQIHLEAAARPVTCPMCSQPLPQDARFPVNWIVANLLHRDVAAKSPIDTATVSTARDARRIYNLHYDRLRAAAERKVREILRDQIRPCAAQGYKGVTVRNMALAADPSARYLRDRVISLLRDRGFQTEKRDSDLYVSWDDGCTLV